MNLRVNWLQIYANELNAISRMSSFPFFVNLSENIVCYNDRNPRCRVLFSLAYEHGKKTSVHRTENEG